MKIINDPVPYVIKAFQEIYPRIEADIQYVPDIESAGCVTINDEQRPLIDISVSIPVSAVPEILAHELAHVINPKDEHGDNWQKTFDKIFNRAVEISKEEYEKGKDI